MQEQLMRQCFYAGFWASEEGFNGDHPGEEHANEKAHKELEEKFQHFMEQIK